MRSHSAIAKTSKTSTAAKQAADEFGEIFIALDRDFHIVYCSYEVDQGATAFRKTLPGRMFWDAFPSRLGLEVEPELHRAMTTRATVRLERFDNPRKRWVEFSVHPTSDGGLSLYIRDVTDRKNDAERQLEEQQRRDNFLAILAHELRNPLAPIRTGLDIMRMRAGNGACIKEVCGMMESQVFQLTRLIEDLLDISRINVGKLELRLTRLNLVETLQVVVESLKPAFDRAKHQFHFTPPAEPIDISGDEARLAQIFVNLLTNAVKYTPQGGRIELSVHTDANEVTVTVADSGIGIPAEMKERIFDIFVQGDQSTDKSHSGLGIGLTLVKSLVAMHHGRIEVHSNGRNHGSKFLVHLPLADTSTKPRSRSTTVATSH